MADLAKELEPQGFCLVPRLADIGEINSLKSALVHCPMPRAERGGQTYGARNILQLSQVRAITGAPKVRSCLQGLLGSAFSVVRGLFFDKTERANWPVPWHQDLSLAVRERRDLAGWTNWTVKRGVTHVQPPAEILRRMVTMRLHLDDCPSQNGPLRLIPQSHGHGVLGRDRIAAVSRGASQVITAQAGDALLMRPLILHASSPAQSPSHRRVLHLEFAPAGLLPAPLSWAEA